MKTLQAIRVKCYIALKRNAKVRGCPINDDLVLNWGIMVFPYVQSQEGGLGCIFQRLRGHASRLKGTTYFKKDNEKNSFIYIVL